jgi:hypothetical protein
VIVLNYDADERWSEDIKSPLSIRAQQAGWRDCARADTHSKWRPSTDDCEWRMAQSQRERGTAQVLQGRKDVSDNTPGPAGSHGARKPYVITNRVENHPITKGLPSKWMHVADELYATLRGPGQNMTVLSTAFSDPANKGTGRDEPILMVLSFGKGRIFHTALGHDTTALNCVGFVTTYQRGTEWAATGKVTQKVPADFPTADSTRTRKEYEPAPKTAVK